MSSLSSAMTIKNQAILALLLNKAEPGKPPTITNIAAGINKSLQDAFSKQTTDALMRHRVKQMENAFSNSSQSTSFKQTLEEQTSALEKSDTTLDSSFTIDVTTADPDSQLAKNLQQAAKIVKQLNLTSEAWGIESLARDLAVFDMDFTAMKDDPYEVAEKIRAKSTELLTELDRHANDPGFDYEKARREITGASARLTSGLNGAAGAVARASVSLDASARTSVVIDGVIIDVTAIIAAGNIIVDPLVFDLNGDGIDMKSAEDGVEFDMNGDGESTRMGFIRGDDALLFVDTYGDGVVHDGTQLFGNQGGYENGFEMLREYDSNGDGVIDENDEIFDKLRLWVEKSEDGVCEAWETMSLREAGISSINLGYDNVREDDGKGNLVGQVGSFTRDDGSKGTAADVWFRELAMRPEGY